MKRVLTAVVLIPLVLLLVFKADPAFLSLALGGVSYFCVREFVEIAKGHGLRPLKRLLFGFVLFPYLVPAFISFAFQFQPVPASSLFLLLLVCAPFAFLIPAVLRTNLNEALPDAAVSLFGFLYIGIGLFSILCLSSLVDYARLLVFCLLAIVWSGDVSAYYVGTYRGQRKLAPRISPNKTWEGAIASFAVATVVGSAILLNIQPIYDWLLTHRLIPPSEGPFTGWGAHLPVFPVWFALSASATINVAAQLGDLIESAMKRGARLKDSGAILPGHGGMLDRVDALLFAAPVAMLLFAATLMGSP